MYNLTIYKYTTMYIYIYMSSLQFINISDHGHSATFKWGTNLARWWAPHPGFIIQVPSFSQSRNDNFNGLGRSPSRHSLYYPYPPEN